jgi:hypothetical protein
VSERRFVYLQRGLVVPLPAVEALLNLERAGHRLRVDGSDIVIELRGNLDAHDAEQLRRWKPHVLLLLSYVASDEHLHDATTQAPEVGPILVGARRQWS